MGNSASDFESDESDNLSHSSIFGVHAMTTLKKENGSSKDDTFDINKLQDAFVLFDKNHDGRISETELNSVLNFLGIKATPADVKKMIAEADSDGNGTVEFDEFLRMMKRYSETTGSSPDAELLEAFRVFDQNNDSFIDPGEIKRTMHFLGEIVSDEDVREMIREADTDNDGRVDFEEFKRMMQLLRRSNKRK